MWVNTYKYVPENLVPYQFKVDVWRRPFWKKEIEDHEKYNELKEYNSYIVEMSFDNKKDPLLLF